MQRLFDMEGPLMNGLSKVFDCILLSLSWIAACLPVVTIGAACGALYRTVYRCVRHEEGNCLRVFWTTWKSNLKSGILTWLPILAVYMFLIADALILRGMIAQGKPMAQLYGIILVLLATASVWAAYCTAYCVRFEGTLRETLWLCLFLVLSHPLMSIVVFLYLAVGAALFLFMPSLLILTPALVCLLMSFPMETVFRKHMRPEDVEKAQSGL